MTDPSLRSQFLQLVSFTLRQVDVCEKGVTSDLRIGFQSNLKIVFKFFEDFTRLFCRSICLILETDCTKQFHPVVRPLKVSSTVRTTLRTTWLQAFVPGNRSKQLDAHPFAIRLTVV